MSLPFLLKILVILSAIIAAFFFSILFLSFFMLRRLKNSLVSQIADAQDGVVTLQGSIKEFTAVESPLSKTKCFAYSWDFIKYNESDDSTYESPQTVVLSDFLLKDDSGVCQVSLSPTARKQLPAYEDIMRTQYYYSDFTTLEEAEKNGDFAKASALSDRTDKKCLFTEEVILLNKGDKVIVRGSYKKNLSGTKILGEFKNVGDSFEITKDFNSLVDINKKQNKLFFALGSIAALIAICTGYFLTHS